MTYSDLHLSATPVYTVADDDIFRDLSPDQRNRVDRYINFADHASGHIFYAPEEHADRLYLLRQGRIRIYKLSPEGRALTLLVLEGTAVFGELALADQRPHDSFAEAMTDCVVGTLHRRELQRVLGEHPSVTLRLVSIMGRRLRALESKLADIAFKSVPQRLATVLLNLADMRTEMPNDGAPPAVVRYTHQQLAEMIGSYRETVTKAIGEFREARLIRVEEEAIFLTDLARLIALAGRT